METTATGMISEMIIFHNLMIEKSTARLDALASAGRDNDDDLEFSTVVQINKDSKTALHNALFLADL